MMIPIPQRGVYRGVEGVDDARAVPGVEDVQITAKPETRAGAAAGRQELPGIHLCARRRVLRPSSAALRDAHARLHFVIDRELTVDRELAYPLACCGTYPGGSAAPSPKKKSSICLAISSCASFCHGIRRYSLRIIFMRSSQSFQACGRHVLVDSLTELAGPRWRIEPGQILLKLHAVHRAATLVAGRLGLGGCGRTFFIHTAMVTRFNEVSFRLQCNSRMDPA